MIVFGWISIGFWLWGLRVAAKSCHLKPVPKGGAGRSDTLRLRRRRYLAEPFWSGSENGTLRLRSRSIQLVCLRPIRVLGADLVTEMVELGTALGQRV
jgi:hypothetical protein